MVNPDAHQKSREEDSDNHVGNKGNNADILQAMFQHYANVGLDHQRQSATTSNLLLVIAGAVLTLIGLDDNLDSVGDAMGAVAVAIIGGFGMIWSWKQHETYKYWTNIAGEYQEELVKLVHELKPARELSPKAEIETAKDFGNFAVHKLRIRYLWVGLHGLVMALGIVLAVAILALNGKPIWAWAVGFILIVFMILILIFVINLRSFKGKTKEKQSN